MIVEDKLFKLRSSDISANGYLFLIIVDRFDGQLYQVCILVRRNRRRRNRCL